MALGLAGASSAEDTLGMGVLCGSSCGVGVQASADTMVAAVPGGIFAITVAYLPPSAEDAFVAGREVKCSPVALRVDALRIGGREGSVDVEFGERVELAAGESVRIVQDVARSAPGVGPDMEQVSFRLRAEAASGSCDLVASGLFFESDGAPPRPFSVLVDDGSKR